MVTEKTRQADERLRQELRNADIDKLKRLMKPLIEKRGPIKLKPRKK